MITSETFQDEPHLLSSSANPNEAQLLLQACFRGQKSEVCYTVKKKHYGEFMLACAELYLEVSNEEVMQQVRDIIGPCQDRIEEVGLDIYYLSSEQSTQIIELHQSLKKG